MRMMKLMSMEWRSTDKKKSLWFADGRIRVARCEISQRSIFWTSEGWLRRLVEVV